MAMTRSVATVPKAAATGLNGAIPGTNTSTTRRCT